MLRDINERCLLISVILLFWCLCFWKDSPPPPCVVCYLFIQLVVSFAVLKFLVLSGPICQLLDFGEFFPMPMSCSLLPTLSISLRGPGFALKS